LLGAWRRSAAPTGRATGAELDEAEVIRAARVVSGKDAKRTFLRDVAETGLDPAVLRAVRRFKTRGSSGKLAIALDAAPTFSALPDGAPNIRGDLQVTDLIARRERAYDDWTAGRFSRDPVQDLMIPTMIDPTMVPPGKHFTSSFVQYAPPRIEGRDWTDTDRDAFGETSLNQIAAPSSGSRDRVLHVEVLTPRELEAEVGLSEGNIFQVDLTRRPAALQPPCDGPCAISRPGPQALALRLLHPSRRHRDGRAGPQRRRRNPARGAPRHPDDRRLSHPVPWSSSAPG
jgi:phytoene dehydrogenase-like protein